MELLGVLSTFEPIVAFALTLAVLATIVTMLLEVLIRILGLKRAGQVKIISQLLKDTVPDADKRWQAVKKILENPFAYNKMADKEADQGYAGWQANGIYAEVSLEHVLRRLTDSSPAAELVEKTRAEVKDELESLARKYDELVSALSADFKRRAQFWSIMTGIALALVLNIDGMRILHAVFQDTKLRQNIIEKIEIPETSEVQAAARTLQDFEERVQDIDEKINGVKAQLEKVGDLGLPIGSAYFPHCYLPWEHRSRTEAVDPLCDSPETEQKVFGSLFWLAKVLVTGLLIGLGAPFWYDVARRLAAVRTVLGGKGSGEEQHRGSDAKGDPAERETLIGRIAADAKAAAASRGNQGG